MRWEFALSFGLLMAWAGATCADVPSPDGTPNRNPHPPFFFSFNPPAAQGVESTRIPAPLFVELTNGEDRQTRLRLPGSVVKQLQAAGPVEDGPGGWAPTPAGTVVAGLALTGAVVLGGFWLIRRPQRRLLGGGVAAAAVMVVVGVCGCPPQQRRIYPPADYQGRQVEEICLEPLQNLPGGVLDGQALLEVDDKDDSIHLMIDTDALTSWGGPVPGTSGK